MSADDHYIATAKGVRRFVTHYWPKPLSTREFDWECWPADVLNTMTYIGFGETESDAIASLMAEIVDGGER